MMLHYHERVQTDDGIYQRIILRHEGYYDEKEKRRQDRETARKSGPCKSYFATPEQIESMLQGGTSR
jgi:hypothetical protein